MTTKVKAHDYLNDRRFQGNDNYGKPRIDYVRKVQAMSLAKLEEETDSKIWLSAFANNNQRSDYHWHVDVCYIECEARQPGMYERVFNRVRKRTCG